MPDRISSAHRGGARNGARGVDLDPYDVLQVSRHASAEVIHAAYRALARGYHPDVNGGDESRQMRNLNAAYELLRDPVRRTAYDARSLALRTRELRQLQTRQRLPIVPPVRRTAASVGGAPPARTMPVSAWRGGPSRAVLLATVIVMLLIVVSLLMGAFAVAAALDDTALSSSFEQLRDIGQTRDGPAQPFLNSR